MRKRANEASEAASSIEAKEVIRLSRQLIRIPSVYHNEHEIARFIIDRLRKWGLSPWSVPVEGFGPDVVCQIGPRKAPCIVLCGHIETVEVMAGWKHDPFGAKIENGMLYGLGSLDMKCGIAAMLLAFRAIAESGAATRTRFVFQAVTGEEDTGYGTWELVKSGAFRGAKAAIVGEGFGGLRTITIGRRGSSYFDINLEGRSAHGATPEKGVNAIADASRLVGALDKMKMRESPKLVGDDFKPLRESQTVLKIRGGGDSLSVPEKCYVYVVNYTLPGLKNTKEEELNKVVKSLRLRSKVDLKMRTGIHLYHHYWTSPESPLVKSAECALKEETGIAPRLMIGLSEADDNIIAHELGIPVICFGPGESGTLARYHQPEEAVSISQLAPAARAYVSTALSLADRFDA
jgi:acetylornithine deacetylase/succinyl-diaminopimelate desuccinylase family protein